MIPSGLIAGTATACVLLLGAAWSDGPTRSISRLGDAERPASVRRRARTISPRARAFAAAGLGAVAGWLAAGPPGLVGVGIAGGVLPLALERRRRSRRVVRLEQQLLDAVTAIASAIRSGRSLVQSVAVAGEEVGAPLGTLLRDAADRVALGVPVDVVLDDLAGMIGGPDARLVAGVLRLHRRTGGAMASSLDDLARTLRARRDGARELRSLTAQARLSAAILGLLPLGFFLFLSVVARRDVESAYRTSAGASAIGIGLALQGAAFVWIRRLLRVEEP